MNQSTREHVPQAERTAVMRRRLMDATVESLVDLGWAGTTTTLVSDRAGVSRGALLHHFPTKQELVLAAVEHLTQWRRDQMTRAAGELPREGRTRAVLEVLSGYFTSEVFAAALELWVAARTDPELHAAVAPIERRIGRETHANAVQLLGLDETLGSNRQLVQATLDLLRGLGLAATLSSDRSRRNQILDAWAGVLDTSLVR